MRPRAITSSAWTVRFHLIWVRVGVVKGAASGGGSPRRTSPDLIIRVSRYTHGTLTSNWLYKMARRPFGRSSRSASAQALWWSSQCQVWAATTRSALFSGSPVWCASVQCTLSAPVVKNSSGVSWRSCLHIGSEASTAATCTPCFSSNRVSDPEPAPSSTTCWGWCCNRAARAVSG